MLQNMILISIVFQIIAVCLDPTYLTHFTNGQSLLPWNNTGKYLDSTFPNTLPMRMLAASCPDLQWVNKVGLMIHKPLQVLLI